MRAGGLRGVFALFWEYRSYAWAGAFFLVLADLLQLGMPLVIRNVVDGIAARNVSEEWVGRRALLLLGMAGAMALTRYAWRRCFFAAGRRGEMSLRNRILRHALAVGPAEHRRIPAGDVMSLATNDTDSVRMVLTFGFMAGFDASVFALVAVGALFWMDPVLALWTLLPLPFLAAAMLLTLRAVYRRWDRVQAAFAAISERVRASVSGVRVIRSFGTEDLEDRRFQGVAAEYLDRYKRYVRVDSLIHPVILFMAGSAIAILLVVGGRRVLDGRTSIGSFIAFATYLRMLVWPMIAAGWMGSLLQRASASMGRIHAFFSREAEPAGGVPLEAPGPGSAVEARSLTFTYGGREEPALRDLSFRIEPGGSLGIVGEVGSGKSTLARLLERFEDPPPRTLFLDGIDVLEYDLKDLRERIAAVPQEAFLFSDTIEENLRIGRPDLVRPDMEAACSSAAIRAEIEAISGGYGAVLGERGITLSGGQKQRLCLARAILKEAPVLLLDDTLSAVDTETEARILEGLSERGGRQTRIVISHRISAVRDLNHILVLQNGEVVQRGSHEELMGLEGFYAELARLQEMEESGGERSRGGTP